MKSCKDNMPRKGVFPEYLKEKQGSKKVAEIALRELIDEKRLQHLQNEFCKVTGVMAVCVDKEGRAITEPYIDKSLIRPDGEDPILGEYRKKAAQALDRVQEGSLEEQVVEELPDGGHVAAVAVSVENQIILYWQMSRRQPLT